MTEELVGIIAGSGLGDALAEQMTGAERHDVDTPCSAKKESHS